MMLRLSLVTITNAANDHVASDTHLLLVTASSMFDLDREKCSNRKHALQF